MGIIKNLSHKIKSVVNKDQHKAHIENEKAIRDNQSQKQIDKTVQDSFPASDPPSTY